MTFSPSIPGFYSTIFGFDSMKLGNLLGVFVDGLRTKSRNTNSMRMFLRKSGFCGFHIYFHICSHNLRFDQIKNQKEIWTSNERHCNPYNSYPKMTFFKNTTAALGALNLLLLSQTVSWIEHLISISCNRSKDSSVAYIISLLSFRYREQLRHRGPIPIPMERLWMSWHPLFQTASPVT